MMLILFSVIIVFSTVVNIVWVESNQIPPFYDNAGHTDLAYIYAHVFRGTLPVQNPIDFLRVSTFYPPLMYIIGGAVTNIFGFYYKNLQYFSVLFMGISAIFLFLYINILCKNKWCGFFSAVFFIFFPHVWEQSRYFMLDLPLTTLVLVSLYLLEKSENFKKNKFTALFFLFAAFAQLTKWYAFVYMTIPFMLVTIKSIRHTGLKKVISKLGMYMAIASFIVLPWYLINFKDILFWTSVFTNSDYGDPIVPFSLKNFSYYLILLINYQIVSFQFLWFLIASVLVIKSKTNLKIYLFLQIIVIYMVFTFFIGNKNLRYLMPLLPFFASVMGYGMYLIMKKSKLFGIILFNFLLIFNILLFTINSFGIPVKSDILITKQPVENLDSIYLLDLSSRAIQYKHAVSDWSLEIVVDDLASLTNQKDTKILVLADNPYVSVAGLRIFSLENKNYLQFRDVPFDRLKKIRSIDEIKSFIKGHEYIILPDQIVAPIGQFNYKNLEAIRKYILGGKTRDYALIKTYNLPNKDILYLLREDRNYNAILVNLNKDTLSIERKPAVANIYLQFMDSDFNWHQEAIGGKEVRFDKKLANISRLRIDYPSYLIRSQGSGWYYDQDKQFDKIGIEK